MIVVFLTCSGLHGVLLQSAAIVAKKLWVDDKITALSKKYVSWVLYAKF